MKANDRYDWEDAIGMPTAEDCKEFCDKADEFLRRRGHYVGRMRSFQYGRGKQREDSAQDENIVVSNQQRG